MIGNMLTLLLFMAHLAMAVRIGERHATQVAKSTHSGKNSWQLFERKENNMKSNGRQNIKPC